MHAFLVLDMLASLHQGCAHPPPTLSTPSLLSPLLPAHHPLLMCFLVYKANVLCCQLHCSFLALWMRSLRLIDALNNVYKYDEDLCARFRAIFDPEQPMRAGKPAVDR